MNIWLLCAYGSVPGEDWRDSRYTIIGNELSAAGHHVTWWTSNFSHHFKEPRCPDWEDRQVNERFRIRLVPGPGYVGNISLGRLRHELLFAYRTWRRARGEARPDCIMVTDPPQTLGRVAVWLGRHFDCPIVFDAMDLWPELFRLALPAPLRGLAPLLFFPFYKLRRNNYACAAAVVSLCETYRQVVLPHFPAPRTVVSMTVFNGIDVEKFRRSMQRVSPVNGLPAKRKDEVWAIYAGSLGESYDLPTLMEAAVKLAQRGANTHILVAGDGPRATTLQTFIAQHALRNLTYLGRLSPDDLAVVYKQCDVGICPYGPMSNVAMPDKAYDYMAAGLPFVSSLVGELADYIEKQGIGLAYLAGDSLSLTRALETIASDSSMRRQMAARSRECAMQFDRHREYGRLVHLIDEVASMPVSAMR